MPTACSVHRSCGLAEYVALLLARSRLSKSVFVYSLIYANKFVELKLSSNSDCCNKATRQRADSVPNCAHCMFLGALMIAFKFTHDNVYKMKYWSEWSGLNIPAIVKLELATLEALNFELMVDTAQFDSWAHAYSEQTNMPGQTSLYSAIMLYFLVIRRLHVPSERRPTTPLSPAPCGYHPIPASRRASVDSICSTSSGSVTPDSPYYDLCRTPSYQTTPRETGVFSPPQTPSPQIPLSSTLNHVVVIKNNVHMVDQYRVCQPTPSSNMQPSYIMTDHQNNVYTTQQRQHFRFSPYSRHHGVTSNMTNMTHLQNMSVAQAPPMPMVYVPFQAV